MKNKKNAEKINTMTSPLGRINQAYDVEFILGIGTFFMFALALPLVTL